MSWQLCRSQREQLLSGTSGGLFLIKGTAAIEECFPGVFFQSATSGGLFLI